MAQRIRLINGKYWDSTGVVVDANGKKQSGLITEYNTAINSVTTLANDNYNRLNLIDNQIINQQNNKLTRDATVNGRHFALSSNNATVDASSIPCTIYSPGSPENVQDMLDSLHQATANVASTYQINSINALETTAASLPLRTTANVWLSADVFNTLVNVNAQAHGVMNKATATGLYISVFTKGLDSYLINYNLSDHTWEYTCSTNIKTASFTYMITSASSDALTQVRKDNHIVVGSFSVEPKQNYTSQQTGWQILFHIVEQDFWPSTTAGKPVTFNAEIYGSGNSPKTVCRGTVNNEGDVSVYIPAPTTNITRFVGNFTYIVF